MTGIILVDRKLSPNLNLRNAISEWLEIRTEKEREDAVRHEREAEEAGREEEEKARQLSMTRAREAEDAARVASIEADAAARVESLRDMVARVEEQMAERVREAEEAIRVATARVREADEAARVAKRVEEDAAARVESLQVMVARVEAETALSHHDYRRKKCSQPQCQNLSRGKGVCVRHGHILKKCNTDGCNNRAQRKGFCKTHGGGRVCLVDGCSLAVFKGLKCFFHYNRPDVHCEVVVMDQPSLMSFDQHVVQNILQFAGGWDNWEWAITFARVCKTWRSTLENRLSQIGLEAMQGGCHRKLNTDAFMLKLTEERFQNAETIYVPCGKAVDLYVNDVRRRCPLMKTLVHRKWLSVDQGYEFVQQGASNLQCRRMYKHDKPNQHGMAWVKWEWDKKFEQVYECQFQSRDTVRMQRLRRQTNFYIRNDGL
jgi:hypothetical protein